MSNDSRYEFSPAIHKVARAKENIEFGIVDEKGRRVGTLIERYETDAIPYSPPLPTFENEYVWQGHRLNDSSGIDAYGHYFGVYIQATRDGIKYGALNVNGHAYFKTAEAREAYIQKKVAACRARYVKKYDR